MYTERRSGKWTIHCFRAIAATLIIGDSADPFRNIQVTLQILRAMIEKSPRDLPLYAPYVLQILRLILGSKDINMVEESIPTWETFCEHHDVATMAADQAHVRRYEEVVKAYASLAGDTPPRTRDAISAPIAIRWKSAGMQAIRCITLSDTVGADGGRQLNIAIPIILQSLYLYRADYLKTVEQRTKANEKSEKQSAIKRRMSIATVHTVDTTPETSPAAVSGTIADADRLAEEEVGLIALQSLYQIFVANNRSQMRIATTAILRFVGSKVALRHSGTEEIERGGDPTSWATTLIEMVTSWAPVQDRFIILVTTMETLVRSPVAEENLQQQLLLVTLVGHLLSSTINMIGLSVMDVLLGLIQHILLLLQLGGKGSNVLPHHQQTDAIDLFKDNQAVLDQSSKADLQYSASDAITPSETRQELLTRLQQCIGDLATHIYYSDQVSDMITAILLRLKPSAMSSVNSTAAAIEDPAAAAQAISNSVNLQEDPNTDAFFSFGTARVTALRAISHVLTVANTKRHASGAGAIGRNRVSVQTWEGTQWLLRDPDRRVRRAYVGALLTWLQLEMSKNDLRVIHDERHVSKGNSKTNDNIGRSASLTNRAASNASQRHKATKPAKSTFLQLLHLASYDNALEAPESKADIILIHLLMASLVEKLGVNAVKSGLPMIARLQEDINIDQLLGTAPAKLNIGSLVHGYLLALSEKFDLDTTLVGYGIQNEINRRRNLGLWLTGIQIPPLPLEQIMSAASGPSMGQRTLEALERESLKPFDAFPTLVDQIANSYATSVASPPTSPPSSPGRVFSMPILTSSGPNSSADHELPASFKEAMLSQWTKESCIAKIERENAATSSLHGSRNGTSRSACNGFFIANDHTPRDDSPVGATTPTHLPLGKQRNQNGDVHQGRMLPASLMPLHHGQLRRSSPHDTGLNTPISSSDQQSTLRVDDLKRVLAGGALAEAFSHRNNGSAVRSASPLRTINTAYQDFGDDRPRQAAREEASEDSDSIVSAEGFESASEGDLTQPLPLPQSPKETSSALAHEYRQQLGTRSAAEQSAGSARGEHRPSSKDYAKSRPRSSSSASAEDPEANARALKGELVSTVDGKDEEEVPPVPPLPPSISLHNNFLHNNTVVMGKSNITTRIPNGAASRPTTAPTRSPPPKQASLSEVGSDRNSLRTGSLGEKKALMQQLLDGIEVGEGNGGRGVGQPPY